MSVKKEVKKVLSSEKIASLVDLCSASDEYVNLKTLVNQIECEIIQAVIALKGNRSKAAFALEAQRTTLIEKLKRGATTQLWPM